MPGYCCPLFNEGGEQMTRPKGHGDGPYDDSTAAALEAFVMASDWNEAFDVLEEQQDVLLSDKALRMLQDVIAQRRATRVPIEELEVYLRLIEDSLRYGLTKARSRFESEWRETGKALMSLMHSEDSDDLNELRMTFRREQVVLLSNTAVVMLRAMVKQAHMRDDSLLAESLEEYLQLLEDARSTSIDDAWQNFKRRQDQQARESIEVLSRFTSVSSLEDAYGLLRERQDVLLSDLALAYLQMQLTELRTSGNSLLHQRLELLIELLENARISGVDAAVERFRKMLQRPQLPEDLSRIIDEINHLTQPHELPRKIELISQALLIAERKGEMYLMALLRGWRATSYIDRQNFLEDDVENMERAIADLDFALTIFTRDADPLDWAMTLVKRGDVYSQRLHGDQTRNIELALADYNAALEVFTRGEFPVDWATIHMHRGMAYRKRLRGNWGENIEQAIKDLTAALEVFTWEAFPTDWAVAHMNRGIIYHARMLGGRAKNIEQAIRDFTAALEVFTVETHPNEWAVTHTNRGSAYLDRIFGKKQENVELAIRDFDAALGVHKREVSPFSWANGHIGRGNAFKERLQGNRAENIEQAMRDYEAALEVFTREAFPTSWARALMNRGNAYTSRILGERAENIEQAIRDYNAALEIFTREALPMDWAQVHYNRAGTYHERIHGSRAENLEQAIEDYNAALQVFTPEALPSYWAQACLGRARIYQERARGSESENLERALEDCNAALEVLTRDALPQEWAAALVTRGNVYRKSTYGDRAENIEQAISDYNAALEVFTRNTQPLYWARIHHDRGIAYLERILGDRLENLEQAVADFNAPLEVFERNTSPIEWAQAHLSRGDAYKARILGERTTNLEQALQDSDAALEVYTREAMPREHRDAQLKRAQILESLDRWQEAHEAFLAVRETINLLLEIASTDIERAEVLSERSRLDFNLIDAQVLLRCQPPELAGVACAFEEGRAQILRRVLDLDTLTATHISDPSAQRRIEAFLAARDGWREAQRLLASSLLVELSSNERESEVRHRRQRLEDAYTAFIQARDAIRHFDNPDFLASEITLKSIAKAIPSNDTALIYLAAGEESGIVLVITCDSVGAPQVQHISLPRFTQSSLGSLFLTRVVCTGRVAGLAGQRELTAGGLSIAQVDVAFELLRNWGDNLREVISTLPKDCSFYAAAQLLVDMLVASPAYRSLLDRPFIAYNQIQYSRIANAFNRSVLNIELERSLKALGELGMSDVSQVLYKQGIHKIILIPYRGLSLFPLSAVQVSLFDEKIQRLGDIFEITIAPSARAAEVAHERAAMLDRVRRPLLLTVGNPEPLPAGVPRLPYAQAEAEATYRIAKTFSYPPDTIRYLRPRDATKERVIKALEQAWYAQLAVHGTYQADEPRLSHLILAGGESIPETARGIYLDEALNGTVNLVGLRLLILSACETARIDMGLSNEVLGLAAGFLQAGAAGVIASLWAVDDQATYLLMSRFAELYLDPGRNWSPAKALAEAQRWLREEATNRVIATYNPAQLEAPASISPALEKRPTAVEALSETGGELMASTARSLRYGHSSALIEIQAQAARRAEIAPEVLPYTDPVYWAAFLVTGC
jgi:CHAT domain-containing protein